MAIVIGSINNDTVSTSAKSDGVTAFATNAADGIIMIDGNDIVYAGGGDDIITGGNGSDTLSGQDGKDLILGEAGNDILYGGNGDDIVEGGDGNDIMYGNQGNDILLGGDGDNTVSGGDGSDIIGGCYGADILKGDAGNDLIVAGPGNDTVYGGAGNDVLNAGPGRDSIYGGEGSDRFDFDLIFDSGVGFGQRDVINGFTFGGGTSGDKVDIHDIDANVGKVGNQDFSFIDTEPFTEAGQVRVYESMGSTIISLNVDSDLFSEMEIRVDDGLRYDANSWLNIDFVL